MAAALTVLGHPPPAELAGAPVSELLAWALGNWQLHQVPRQLEVRCPDFA
jgi:glutamyl-Q tRNA(Asp) synthetase